MVPVASAIRCQEPPAPAGVLHVAFTTIALSASPLLRFMSFADIVTVWSYRRGFVSGIHVPLAPLYPYSHPHVLNQSPSTCLPHVRAWFMASIVVLPGTVTSLQQFACALSHQISVHFLCRRGCLGHLCATGTVAFLQSSAYAYSVSKCLYTSCAGVVRLGDLCATGSIASPQ